MRIVWDETKRKQNIRDHGIDFKVAQHVFFDPCGIDSYDDVHSTTEDRFKVLGRVEHQIMLVVYTERQGEIRLISARPPERAERKRYYENEKEQHDRS